MNGWGGRTRTFTVRINSAVPYRLDHAPVERRKSLPQSKLLHKGHPTGALLTRRFVFCGETKFRQDRCTRGPLDVRWRPANVAIAPA